MKAAITKSALALLLTACANGSGKDYTLDAQITQTATGWDVNGRSNLPEQAQILVALLDPAYAGNYSKHVVVQEFGTVKNQGFHVKLKPLQTLKPGKYQIQLSFSPTSYDWSDGKVLAEVGTKGEKLGGKYRVTDQGVNKLVNTLTVEYKGN